MDTRIDTMLIADGGHPAYATKSSKSSVKDLRRRIRRAVETVDPDGIRLRVRPLSQLMELPEYQTFRAAPTLGYVVVRPPELVEG